MLEYLKDSYDNFNEELLGSALVISATIYILAQEVAQDSIYEGFGDIIDGRESAMVQKSYPLDLEPHYRVEIMPIEIFGRSGDKYRHDVTPAGRFDPYDMWVSIFESKVKVRGSSTYFDYADSMQVGTDMYGIKGIVKESFGNKPVVHVFLTKETS